MLFHELALGLDCSPSAMAGVPRPQVPIPGGRYRPPVRPRPGARRKDEGPALYTFVISTELCPGHVQIFGAMIARSAIEVRERLRLRCGPTLVDEAIVRIGFDWSEPMACAMVSDAMAHVLALASKDPTSSIAAGLDFQVEQRFVK
ncbi:hypothetical protein [Sphingomonas kyeonggiensis]|nr:hypothetical protein [Sphingomonas kyeonggiensis]